MRPCHSPASAARPHNALVCWLAAIILEEKRFLQKRPNLSRAPNFSFFRASVLLCAPAQWTVTCFEVSKICVWWMRRMECVWVLWALKGPSTTRLLLMGIINSHILLYDAVLLTTKQEFQLKSIAWFTKLGRFLIFFNISWFLHLECLFQRCYLWDHFKLINIEKI